MPYTPPVRFLAVGVAFFIDIAIGPAAPCALAAAPPPAAAAAPPPAAVPATPEPPAPKTYPDSIQAWREARVKRLRSDTGWLTVAGLFWLSPGENSFGANVENAIVLPENSAPEHAGWFRLETGAGGQVGREGERVVARARPGVELRLGDSLVTERALRADDAGAPDLLHLGSRLSFFAIRRGERLAIRMRDLESPIRLGFTGIDYFPIDPSYRVVADFTPLDPPRKIPVPNIAGYADSMIVPGTLSFTLAGARCTLTPVHEDPADSLLFIIFGDSTTERETYGGGRFLYADPPRDGRVLIDFNKAYNPPCSFTPFTTCPRPPKGNTLPVAVRAGEKKYAGSE